MTNHKCGYKECTNCKNYVDKAHQCSLNNVRVQGGFCTVNKNNPCRNDNSIKKKDLCFSCKSYTENYNFYDFECTQNTEKHEANVTIAQDFNGKEYMYKNLDQFWNNMINKKLKVYTLIAHNSKGYDARFILKWFVDQGMKPYCVYNDAKIMHMEIPKLRIRFIDSLNFIQMPLKNFQEHLDIGSLPSKKHYGYDQMKSDDRDKFLKWNEERNSNNCVFYFNKEFIEYCRSDVDILRRSIFHKIGEYRYSRLSNSS